MRALLFIAFLSACGGSTSSTPPAETTDSAVVMDTAVVETAEETSTTTLRRCPTSGRGAVAGDVCFNLTPAESGLPAGGTNANVDQYALRPTSGARGKLFLFFNGSGGSPLAGTRGSATDNLYATARGVGLHVFAVSYRSDDSVGMLCKGNDACFLPTRRTIMTGSFETGAAPELSTIATHEGALPRLYAALKTLAARDPMGGWGAFIDETATKPGEKIKWSLIVASGHSQGGGHAAVIGHAFAIDRVVALASPCDTTLAGAPASWLDVSKTKYATSPATAFHGLGAPGDMICAGYASNWTALGMDASRKHADATICSGSAAHAAPLECVENAPAWKKMMTD